MDIPVGTTKIGQCVANWPRTARVFEAHRIDYCCGGDREIASACEASSVDVQQLLGELQAAVSTSDSDRVAEPRWLDEPLERVCQHLVDTHHAYLRSELPRLAGLVEKVLRVHGDKHPELEELAEAFAALHAELIPHMMKEEQILFPAIWKMEHSASVPSFPFGTVANPVRMMILEHVHAGDELARIRRATRDFTPPADACPTYVALFDGLRELEGNMHQHVHKENNILFPRAIQLEQSLRMAAER